MIELRIRSGPATGPIWTPSIGPNPASPEHNGPVDPHVSLGHRGDYAAQIYRDVRAAILDGRLAAGDRLPPSRVRAPAVGVPQHGSSRLRAAGRGGTAGGPGRFRHLRRRPDPVQPRRPAGHHLRTAIPGAAGWAGPAARVLAHGATGRLVARAQASLRLPGRHAGPGVVPGAGLAPAGQPRTAGLTHPLWTVREPVRIRRPAGGDRQSHRGGPLGPAPPPRMC